MAENYQKGSSNQNLTNLLLNGSNYLPWARAVRVALGGRSKFGYVTGTSKPPVKRDKDETYDEKLEEWQATDLSVMSWIFNSMEPQIYEIFAYANTAKELWDSLYEMYGHANNSSRVFELQQNLSNQKQGTGQSFTDHLGKMKKQWEELQQYRPRAATVQEYVQREEQDKIFALLASLNAEFEEPRREILMRSEMPNFSTVCSIIQTEETRKRVMSAGSKVNTTNSIENFAHYISNSKIGDSNKGDKERRNSRFFCDHCRRTRHTRDRCWILYPHLKPAKKKTGEAFFAAPETTIGAAAATEPADVQTQLNLLNRQMHELMKSHATSTSDPKTAAVANNFGNSLVFFTDTNSHIVVDSGATDHMLCSKTMLNHTSDKGYPHVTVANGTKVPTHGKGTTQLFTKDIEALIVPDLKTNLLSVSKWTNEWNCNVVFTPQKVIFQDRISGRMIGEGKLVNGLYVLSSNSTALMTIDSRVTPNIWHMRLGHPSDRILQNLNMSLIHDSNNCDSCHFAKQHRLPFHEHSDKSNDVFDLVHSDTWGNAPVNSKEGFKYFVTFIDDKSRATWLYLLKSKREVLSIFQDFFNMVQNQFGKNIKILRTDNGTKYTNHEFQTTLRNLGISHQTTCPGTPQQNGVAERKNRHLLEVTRALLFSGSLPKTFWADAVLTSCYLINRLPSRILNYQSPLEILYKRKINISHLRVFGCVCYMHIQGGDKLEPRAQKCVFLGYSSVKKGYKYFDPKINRVYFSRDVLFTKNQM